MKARRLDTTAFVWRRFGPKGRKAKRPSRSGAERRAAKWRISREDEAAQGRFEKEEWQG
jgi:hypothetical protein